MGKAAARGRRLSGLLAALALLLLLAGRAEASRFSPSAAAGLAEEQGIHSLASLSAATDLAAAFAFDPSTHFPLFTADQRLGLQAELVGLAAGGSRPRSFGLRLAPAPAPIAVGGEKLASAPSPLLLEINLWQINDFASISRWVRDEYAYVAWQPQMATDPMGLGAERDINAFFAADVAAALALEKERKAEALRQHRLHPGLYAIEGSAFRGRLYYLPSQMIPGVRDEGTAWNPFFGATQAGADLRAYEREHSKEALGVDVATSLVGPGKLAKLIGVLGAALTYAEREQQAAEWGGRARVLRNEAALGPEGRHIMAQLERMTNEAEDLLESGNATSPAAQRYYAAQSQKKWWAFFMRGQALQTEIENLRAQAAQSDAILAEVKVRPGLFGLIPDFIYTQATGERVIIDVTSPRASTFGKALKYAKEAQDIIIELYHRGRGMPK